MTVSADPTLGNLTTIYLPYRANPAAGGTIFPQNACPQPL